MTAIAFRSPVTRPLHPSSWVRPSGSLDFRVTQEFDDRDFYWNDGRTHNATDIGNARCGDPIVAMAAGTAWRIKDNASALQPGATDALGIRIDHGQGVTTEYWHLNAWTVADGAWVNAGQQTGILGSTGLGSVCHCHVEMKVNGVRRDPEPHMFGAAFDPASTATLPNTAMSRGDPMLVARYQGWRTNKAAIVYDAPNGSRVLTFQAGTLVSTSGETLEGLWRLVAASTPTIGRRHCYIERKDLDALTDPFDADFDNAMWSLLLSRKAPVAADTRALTNKIARATTAAEGSLQAAQVTVNALKG